MVTNPFIRPGAASSAMRGIGQVLQRRRGTYLAQQSPYFLRPLEQRYNPLVLSQDHGVSRALPANAKSRSNE